MYAALRAQPAVHSTRTTEEQEAAQNRVTVVGYLVLTTPLPRRSPLLPSKVELRTERRQKKKSNAA